MEEKLVFSENGKILTDSYRIAKKFEKRHSDVIRSIENQLEVSVKLRSHCVLISYEDDQGKNQPLYVLDKDAYTFIAMGFTGKKATDFKWEFIEAFNYMEQTIRSGNFARIEVVEQNIKRRYLLRTELSEVNRNIERDMRRQREIKKELKQIDMQDFNQLQIFPRYTEHEPKATFPIRRIS